MREEKLVQQGDVLIFKVTSLPKGVKPRGVEQAVVLAEGEATGHAHRILEVESVDLFEDKDGTLYLRVKEPVVVRHEEHAPVTLDPGIYRRGIVREVDPFSREIREVMD